jgi:transposase InsO family protein
MHDNDIRAKSARKFKHTTDSNQALPVADNLLDRQFEAQGPTRLTPEASFAHPPTHCYPAWNQAAPPTRPGSEPGRVGNLSSLTCSRR